MSRRTIIRVIEPGMLTTVQDLGRSGWSAIGVGRGGAADTLSLRAGNRMVGNEDSAAGLEMTLTGGTFEFESDALNVVTGAQAAVHVVDRSGEHAVSPWMPFAIRAGQRLVVGPIRSGVRAYLLVAGGIIVPRLLGSRSTHLVGAFGGLSGRPLRSGDTLEFEEKPRGHVDMHLAERFRGFCESRLSRRTLRAVDGAHHGTFSDQAVAAFWDSAFRVSDKSDRAGLRLKGPLEPSTLGGRMPSEGMMAGAVQVPASGAPIVLMVDYPTTGGYPVIACVAAVDLPVLGQVRPRQVLRFERVSVVEARTLFDEQERALDVEVPAQ